MHTATLAEESLHLLWHNLHTLCKQVDLESMTPERLDFLIQRQAKTRPFRIAAWHARQGYFIAAWSLWEFYATSLCERLPTPVKRDKKESTPAWVGRFLTTNGLAFPDQAWFCAANGLRNLIAHYGCRARGAQAEKHLKRAQNAFPELVADSEGYVAILHGEVAELQLKIEEFFRDIPEPK